MKIKESLIKILKNSLHSALTKDLLGAKGGVPPIFLEIPKNAEHGDLATNLALTMAASERKSPKEIAQIVIENIEDNDIIIKRIEIADPGFINFFLKETYWYSLLKDIEKEGNSYGQNQIGKGKRVQIEFVSANPTGPLHIGHGRGAAIGNALANLLETSGFEVEREYYINDVGKQMEILGRSVFLRSLQIKGKEVEFPSDYYQGDYIWDIAREVISLAEKDYLDLEEAEVIPLFTSLATDCILKQIKKDLVDFGVRFDYFFSEKRLFEEGKVFRLIADLSQKGYIYSNEGALWFKTTSFGDTKDRVVVRRDGVPTYFASDVAYHKYKFDRGFDMVINIWGADHHGYIPRIKAIVQALGKDSESLKILLVQLVNLLRAGKPVAMSTRSGEFTPLRDVIEEVGGDAAKYFFLMRRSDSPSDFDLELAKRKGEENPVYYVQYAHARICSILNFAKEKNLTVPKFEKAKVELLNLQEELTLIKQIALYPEVVEGSALSLESHRLPTYLNELASNFHRYYNQNRVVSSNLSLTSSRLFLVKMIGTVLRNALQLIGVSAPESM